MDETNPTHTIHASTAFSLKTQESIIIFCAIVAIGFGIYNVQKIMAVHISKSSGESYEKMAQEMDTLDGEGQGKNEDKVLADMVKISKLIQDGASTFLR